MWVNAVATEGMLLFGNREGMLGDLNPLGLNPLGRPGESQSAERERETFITELGEGRKRQ